VDGDLFTGDTLTATDLGRADLPGSDRDTLEESVTMLAEICPPDTTIRPGHGEPGRIGDMLVDRMSLTRPP
jgi:glyoxylase-like metal-dependent hydrolase (beta-lactamase superfamily II)